MSDPLTRDEAAEELAKLWDEKAASLESLDPRDRAAVALRKCSDELRRITDEHAVDYVSHAQVRIRTGRSDSYLYRLYKELEAEGSARRGPRGWEITREAALRIPTRRGHDPVEATDDLDELAQVYLEHARAG